MASIAEASKIVVQAVCCVKSRPGPHTLVVVTGIILSVDSWMHFAVVWCWLLYTPHHIHLQEVQFYWQQAICRTFTAGKYLSQCCTGCGVA